MAIGASAGDIYVSAKRGNDKADGTSAAPFSTLHRALKEAREWRRLSDVRTEGGIRILMEGGVYPLGKPVLIRPEDSGTPQSPTVICAVGGQEPVISGGIRVEGWKPAPADARIPVAVRGRVWVSEAPMKANQVVPVAQMYVNGCKAERAKQFSGDRMERMAALSDGVIVGSAIVRIVEKYGEKAAPEIYNFVKSMTDAVHKI